MVGRPAIGPAACPPLLRTGRFLVTGGAGFIGSHLTDAVLAAGHDVVVLDDPTTGRRANLDARAALREGSILDEAPLAAAMTGVAGCFHLAAVSSVERCENDIVAAHRVNLEGSLRQASAAAPVVNVGTGRATRIVDFARMACAAYGRDADRHVRFGPARGSDIAHSVADTRRLHRALGFVPATPLADGLRLLAGAPARAAQHRLTQVAGIG